MCVFQVSMHLDLQNQSLIQNNYNTKEVKHIKQKKQKLPNNNVCQAALKGETETTLSREFVRVFHDVDAQNSKENVR